MLFAITLYESNEVLSLVRATSHHEAYEAYRADQFGNGCVGYDVDVIGADYTVEF